MALNASSLASEIESGVRSAMELGSTPYPQMTAYCNALASAIVNHIKDNLSVQITIDETFAGTVTGLTSSTPVDVTVEGVVS